MTYIFAHGEEHTEAASNNWLVLILVLLVAGVCLWLLVTFLTKQRPLLQEPVKESVEAKKAISKSRKQKKL